MRRAIALATLASACNAVLGIHATRAVDGRSDPELACPASYVISTATGTAYRKTDNAPVTFQTAAGACAADQPASSDVFTHVVVVSSAGELAFLIQTLGADGHWVGLTDLKSASYQWVTREQAPIDPAYWASGEPNMTSIEQCVFVGQYNQFTDHFDTVDCASLRDYICECDGFADDPTRY